MLDVHMNPVAPLSPSADHAAVVSVLPVAIRNLFARLAGRAPAPLADDAGSAGADRYGQRLRRLRAEADAAYRSVEGAGAPALNAALAVLEAEICRQHDAAEDFAEALKAVRVYGSDPAQRAAASAVLDRYQFPLRQPPTVPHQSKERSHG